MKTMVTGGAGFIGSHLVDRLVKNGDEVIIFDNLSKENPVINPKARFVKGDLLNLELLKKEMSGIEMVWHFAANANMTKGIDQTDLDLKYNIIGTYNVLEAMRVKGVKKIVFASSSTVYGETKVMPTPENHPLQPASLYGASKASDEALISAFVNMFGLHAWVFRFCNILGSRHSRGVIHDFILKLKKDPKKLYVLGDGNQLKSYLLVSEMLDAIFLLTEKAKDKFNVFNVCNETATNVKSVAKIVAEEMKASPQFIFENKPNGWIGDVPNVLLDIKKAKSLGWKPKLTSAESVKETTKILKTS